MRRKYRETQDIIEMARIIERHVKSELVDSIFDWHGNMMLNVGVRSPRQGVCVFKVKRKQTAFEVEINDYIGPTLKLFLPIAFWWLTIDCTLIIT